MLKRIEVTNSINEIEMLLDEIRGIVPTFTTFDEQGAEITRLSEKAARLGLGGLPAEFLRAAGINTSASPFATE